MEKTEIELLNSLLALNKIFKNKTKNYNETVIEESFCIRGYKFALFFIYDSITIVIKKGYNLTSCMFDFSSIDVIDDKEKKAVKTIASLPDLPPNLIINELNKIGVKEL